MRDTNIMFSTFIEIKVHTNIRISHNSRVLSFMNNFSFRAGQVIGITVSPTIPPRLYSIASGEQEEKIEILYKIVSEGILTPRLDKAKPGDSLYITPPFGNFISSDSSSFFVATGTGIAPYLSMIRSGFSKCKKLLHGSRIYDDFYYDGFLQNKLGEKYVQCYTGPDNYPVYRGRVTNFLNEYDQFDSSDKYYLCGSAEMIVEAREVLIRRGIPFQNIKSEIYF